MVQKFALLVGCNYPETQVELKGCIHDANSIHDLLIKRFEFYDSNVELLTDQRNSDNIPNAANIKAVLDQFFSDAKSGDLIFLFFSGHGTVIPGSYSSSGKDEEAIVPCDFNLITCMDFRKILHGAKEGVTFIFMSDSCHSGGLIDKETEQIGPDHNPNITNNTNHANAIISNSPKLPKMIPFQNILHQLSLQTPININIQTQFVQMFGSQASLIFRDNIQFGPPLKADQGILLSGCQSDEFCTEDMFEGMFHGVFTWAVLTALEGHLGPFPNKDFVVQTRKILEDLKKEDQHPCLYCSDENVGAFFLCENFRET